MIRPSTGGSETATRPNRFRERVHLDELGSHDRLDDELGDPVTAAKLDRCCAIGVDDDHLDLTSIAGVDGAGSVDQGQPVAESQAGSRMDKSGIPRRERHRNAGPDAGSFAWRELDILGAEQIGPRVAVVGICRRRQLRV
jgi:hypothetical protein